MARTGKRAAAVQEDRRDAEPGRARFERRHPRRHGHRGPAELAKFVREGGTLITEGSTATIFPEYGMTTGVTVEKPARLFVRGSILRGRSPTREPARVRLRGHGDLPVYFNQAPVLNAGGVAARRARRRRAERRAWADHHAERAPLRISPFEPEPGTTPYTAAATAARAAQRRCSRALRAAHGRRTTRHPPAGRDAVFAEPERSAAVRHAGQRPGARRAAPPRSTSGSATVTS